MTSYKDYLNEQLKDPEFKAEYEALEPEFVLRKTLLEARTEKGLTQQKLSELTGISQADISRLEGGNANPSLHTIQRIAKALGKRVVISFV